MAQSAAATDAKRADTLLRAPSAPIGQPQWRAVLIDTACLLIPLTLLTLIVLRVVATGLLQYPDPANTGGDYYRYVNMALPDGSYYYSHLSPFLNRILVPLLVHGMIILGVPFQAGFFSLASLSFVISTICMFYLVRGAGLSRFEATCASLAFVTLQWAVAYNIRDYFLVDPEAQAFVTGALLAVQREKFRLAAVIVTIGMICKENLVIAVVVTLVQLAVPYLRPVSGAFQDLLNLRFIPLIKRVPITTWIMIALVVAGPVTVSIVENTVLHPIGTISTLHAWRHYLPDRLKDGLLGLYVPFAVSTWGTFAAFFAIALGSLVLRVWPRGRFSIWALLAAFLIIVYSYTVSGDSRTLADGQRVSIVGWPFVLLYAAIVLHELAVRLRVPTAFLWGLAFVAQLAFQPVAGPPGAVIVGPAIGPFLTQYGGDIMAVVAWIFVALIVYVWLRDASIPPAAALAGASTSAVTLGPSKSLQPTTHLPALRSLDGGPLPADTDSAFWASARGGLVALENLDLWLASDRLQVIASTHVLPLAQRDLGLSPAQIEDPRLTALQARWLDQLDQPAGIWRSYDAVMSDYRALRSRLGIAFSPRPALEREALATLEIATRHDAYDTREVVSWRRISIVVPASNIEATLPQIVRDCLRTVRRFSPNAEVIVVDDGSGDRTGAIADEWASRDARVVALHNQSTLGYHGALQAGFTVARGEWLFFLDSNEQLSIDDFAQLLRMAEQRTGTIVMGFRWHR